MGGEISSIAAKLAGRIGEAHAKTDREGRFLSLLQYNIGEHLFKEQISSLRNKIVIRLRGRR